MLILEMLRVKTRYKNVSECKSCPSSVSGVGVAVAAWPGAGCEVTALSPALCPAGRAFWTPAPLLGKIRKMNRRCLAYPLIL